MSIEEKFSALKEKIQTLTYRPTNEQLLQLYSLYKQATEGDVSEDKPGMFDFKGVAKYNAWEKLKGTDKESAMQQYVSLAEELLEANP